MNFNKNQVEKGHIYLGEARRSTYYKISVTHNGRSKFLIEVLDNLGNILYRPHNFEVKSLPNVPYVTQFVSPVVGTIAIHYFESAENTWDNVIADVEVK